MFLLLFYVACNYVSLQHIRSNWCRVRRDSKMTYNMVVNLGQSVRKLFAPFTSLRENNKHQSTTTTTTTTTALSESDWLAFRSKAMWEEEDMMWLTRHFERLSLALRTRASWLDWVRPIFRSQKNTDALTRGFASIWQKWLQKPKFLRFVKITHPS